MHVHHTTLTSIGTAQATEEAMKHCFHLMYGMWDQDPGKELYVKGRKEYMTEHKIVEELPKKEEKGCVKSSCIIGIGKRTFRDRYIKRMDNMTVAEANIKVRKNKPKNSGCVSRKRTNKPLEFDPSRHVLKASAKPIRSVGNKGINSSLLGKLRAEISNGSFTVPQLMELLNNKENQVSGLCLQLVP